MAEGLASCRLRLFPQPWILQLAGWRTAPGRLDTEVLRLIGANPPPRVGDRVRAEALILLRVAPHRLWLVAPDAGALARIEGQIDPLSGCATSVGFGQCRFGLDGPGATAALAKLCALDFDSPQLAPGRAAWTAIDRLPTLLAESIWERLADAALAFGRDAPPFARSAAAFTAAGARTRRERDSR
jgi:sarcosine oxidase gamma subunit